MSGQPKLSSRLSSLNMFGKFANSTHAKPPPPVEKDPWYQQGGSKSAVSLAPSSAASIQSSSVASMSVETLQLPQTPLSISASRSQCDLSRTMSPVSTRSRTTTMTASTAQTQASEMSSFRRGISKISNSFGKKSKLFLRPNSSRATLSVEITRASEEGLTSEEEAIPGVPSRPRNFQHHLHVDEGLAGLPPEWLNKLREEGFKDTDVLSVHSRRNRTTYLQHHPDVSPDAIRARSRSPYTPLSPSNLPSSVSPLPASALPTRSTSLRRPTTAASDGMSVSMSARSGGSSRSPDSTSPPSSYGFSSPSRPYVSSVSSRTPSMYTDDGDDDDFPDPGTATALQFSGSAAPTSVSRGLPRMDSTQPDSPATRTPPSRAATLTFHVVNGGPPSPPPAYDVSEPESAQTQAFPRDEKSAPPSSSPGSEGRRASGSDVQLQTERHSEETLTPEVLSRTDNNDSTLLGRATRDDEQAQSPPPFKLHVATGPREESLSPTSTGSPAVRTASLPPRLSLHQDDLSSWSASLFSAMSTPDPELGSFVDSINLSISSRSTSTPAPDESIKTTSPKTRKPPVPLDLSRTSNDIPRVTIETDEDEDVEAGSNSIEHGAGTSTPLFNEVLSLVNPPSSVSPNSLSPVTSTYPYLPSPPLCGSPKQTIESNVPAQPSPSGSPNVTYEFLKDHYDPHRNSIASTSVGSRDSQATISASSRWSRATTVRDVREATIVHVRKTSVANAMTVPAPASTKYVVQPKEQPTQMESGDGSRPLSTASSIDGVSASDFPLPPPSPGDAAFQPSPMSAKFSIRSTGSDVRLPYAVDDTTPIDRLSSPSSVRSSQSSSASGSSSSSSQVNPLSIRSESDEGPEENDDKGRLNGAVHVELRYTESESEGSVLSPTESDVDPLKWGTGQKDHSPPAKIDVTPRIYMSGADDDDEIGKGGLCYERDADGSDGGSAVVDWLEDAPSPRHELRDKPLRDSGTLSNYLNEPSPRKLLHPDAADRIQEPTSLVKRPSLQINGIATLDIEHGSEKSQPRASPASNGVSPSSSSSATPSPSPLQRYRGWVSEVVAPLEEFIDHDLDPRELFTDLQEVAEGESGSVFAATVVPLPIETMANTNGKGPKAKSGVVAIKQVPLLPGGSPKLGDLRKELLLMSRISHPTILTMDALFVDLVEDALWIEMELMDRSLADVLSLVEEGLVLEEKVIARFASDILNALAHLESLGIAHRDVRSDNLLVNGQGVLKISDFSNALLVDPASPTYTDPTGVIYWQAPEMRSGSYDARKVDAWSAGATVWELAEVEPPFMRIESNDPHQLPDRWPPLSQADIYSRSFHDFLTLCSNPPSSRPFAHDLLTTPFILSSCARSLIVDLLAQCKSIEERIHRRTSSDSQGTVLS